MELLTGKIVEGKVVLDGDSFAEGTLVTVIANSGETSVRLPKALQMELEEALEEADREEGISGGEMLEKLKAFD
jgi:hypothetical protein